MKCGSAFSVLVVLGDVTLRLTRGFYWSWGPEQSKNLAEGGKGVTCGIYKRCRQEGQKAVAGVLL